MSYREFLDNIDSYVGKVVEFTSRFKADGKTFKTERYVWDNKEFGEPDKDALIEVIEVKVIRDGNLNTSVKGIIGGWFYEINWINRKITRSIEV